MSEFQLSLLTIGIFVVVGVYLYGFWQQWRYRHSQDESFKSQFTESPVQTASNKGRTIILAEEQDDPLLGLENNSDSSIADEICGLLNDATDYVVTFMLEQPLAPYALDTLWQRRFDFGKSVHACGQNSGSDLWERLIPDSEQTYRAFRLSLQLVDRTGPVSEMRLTGFRDLLGEIARQLQIDVRLPSVEETLRRANELDQFCADVDQMIGINLLTGAGRRLFGTEIFSLAERLGMSLQSDGTFHLADEFGVTQFNLSASDGTLFQHHTLNQTRVDSLTLLLDIPRVSEPVRCFDKMEALAQELAKTLRATLVDDQRVALSEGAIAQIRAQVAATEERMLAGHITPGSAQALRLFS